jgi:hypothetical protein
MGRRTNARIQEERAVAWKLLKGEGVNLYTLCLACGQVAHCRGRNRESVRCESCFMQGASGARIVYTVLHERRSEVECRTST